MAQELIFVGFLLGFLDQHFPRRWHHTLPINTAVVITAVLFGMWHFIPDFVLGNADADYAAFRFAYTTGGMVVFGMTRLWTGSIVYAVITHSAVKYLVLLETLSFEL